MPGSYWTLLSSAFALLVTGCVKTPVQQAPTPNGAAVEFHVAADAKDVGPEVARRGADAQFNGREAPPTLTSTLWLPFNDIEQMYFGSPDERQKAKADPATYFRETRGLVVERSRDDLYVLVYTDALRSMTTTDPPEWRVVTTCLMNDNLGNAAVGLELDVAGARRLYDFTTASVGRAMAIAVGGRVYSIPVIVSPISTSVLITGSFDHDEAKEIEDRIVFGDPQAVGNR